MSLMPRPLLLLLSALAVAFGAGTPASAQAPGASGASGASVPDEGAAVFKRCKSPLQEEERDCYTAALMERLAHGGPAAALKLLDRLGALDADARRDGHMYAHHIGIAALKSPDEVGRVFASCTPGWQSGCYHGVIQSYFMAVEKAGGGVTTESVDALCGDYRATRRDLLFQCTHGLGHGLAIYHRRDLPQALGSCDLLTRGTEREMCYAGAFMENIVAATQPHESATKADSAKKPAKGKEGAGHSDASGHGGHGDHGHHGSGAAAAAPAKPFKALDRDDLHYPCSAVAQKYLAACYTIQTSAMLHHTGQDVGRTAAECGRAPQPVRATCFMSLGRDVSTLAWGDSAKAVRLCGLADAAFRPACHRGVVESIVNMNADPAEGIPYCRAVPEADGKRACYAAVGLQALVLPDGEAKREQACRSAEAAGLESCLGRPAATGAAAAPAQANES